MWKNKDGSFSHAGDCSYYSHRVCDCGLLSHLRFQHEERSKYPKFSEQLAEHERRLELMRALSDEDKSLLEEYERIIKYIARAYVDSSCSRCGSYILEAVLMPMAEGEEPQKMSEVFGDIFDKYVCLCAACADKDVSN